jgi:hypothetical protein
MVFVVASKYTELFGHGKYLSRDRYEIAKGLSAFFYDSDSVLNEFSDFGMMECKDIEEPVKFMPGENSVWLKIVICRKD